MRSDPTSDRTGTVGGPLQRLTNVERLGLGLAAFTGVVHLYMAYEELAEPSEAFVFLLAAAGFFLGIALFVRGTWPRWLFLLGAAFTGVQIPLWILEGMEEFSLGAVDKVAQVVLVCVLLYAYSQASRRTTAAVGE